MEEKYFNALVRGLVDAGSPAEAEGVITRMHNDSLNLELVSQRRGTIPPSAATYGMVINAYCAVGDVASAQRLLNQMRWKRIAPSLQVFNMMIKGFGNARMPKAAEVILREMEGSGSWDMDRLGISPDLVCFTSMINAWAVVGDTAKARGRGVRRGRFHLPQPALQALLCD